MTSLESLDQLKCTIIQELAIAVSAESECQRRGHLWLADIWTFRRTGLEEQLREVMDKVNVEMGHTVEP
jgi:hypothetical protein